MTTFHGTPPLVLDGPAVLRLAQRTGASLAIIATLRDRGLWPPVVPTAVLPDCLTGDAEQDEPIERLLPCCDVAEVVPEAVARRAAWLRTAANSRASAAESLVVAMAEPGGAILTSGRRTELEALALFDDGVYVERI